MTSLTTIAASVFHQYGEHFDEARRAGGWTNAVWLTERMALRLSTAPGGERIRREIALSALLPKEARYPEVVATGVCDGHEWSLCRRVPGVNLSDAWPGMSWAERTRATERIIAIAEAVHAVKPEAVQSLVGRGAWYSALDARADLAATEALVERGALTRAQGRSIERQLKAFYGALPLAPRVLNHGDFTTDNILWHEGEFASLMDFEHATLAPAALDWNSIARLAYGPESAADSDAPDGGGAGMLQDAVARALRPRLADESARALLVGFALLHCQKRLAIWLDGQPDHSDMATWEPHRSLAWLADGQGGFFSPLF